MLRNLGWMLTKYAAKQILHEQWKASISRCFMIMTFDMTSLLRVSLICNALTNFVAHFEKGFLFLEVISFSFISFLS